MNLQVTYLEQWNLSIEKQIAANWLIKAQYLGNNTIHLWGDSPIDAPVFLGLGACTINGVAYPVCSTTANENQRRPLVLQNQAQGQYYGTIHQLDPSSTASYNALLVSLEHRFAKNFEVLGNYTYSHCITDPFTSELDGVEWTNPGSRRFDRGNCVGIDHRQLLNISAVGESPRFGDRWMRAIAGDWRLSVILRAQSGSYYSVTSGIDTALTGIGGQRANQVLASPYCASPNANCWLNPQAFATPANGTYGNAC